MQIKKLTASRLLLFIVLTVYFFFLNYLLLHTGTQGFDEEFVIA